MHPSPIQCSEFNTCYQIYVLTYTMDINIIHFTYSCRVQYIPLGIFHLKAPKAISIFLNTVHVSLAQNRVIIMVLWFYFSVPMNTIQLHDIYE